MDSESEWDQTVEGMEGFVFRKIYFHLMGCADSYDVADSVQRRDLDLNRRIEALSWIGSQHLRVDFAGLDHDGDWSVAVGHLHALSSTRTPFEKQKCLVMAFQAISDALKLLFVRIRGADPDAATSADSGSTAMGGRLASGPALAAGLATREVRVFHACDIACGATTGHIPLTSYAIRVRVRMAFLGAATNGRRRAPGGNHCADPS